MTRHETQVLRAAGVPERVVAERTAVSVRSVERTEERLRLRPLPIAPPAYALNISFVVSARGRVRHAGVDYSMPAHTLGQTATLQVAIIHDLEWDIGRVGP